MSLELVLQISPGVTPYQRNHSPDLISLKGFNWVRGNPERKEVRSCIILTKGGWLVFTMKECQRNP